MYKINKGMLVLSGEILNFLEEHKVKYEEKNGAVFVDGDIKLYAKKIPKNLNLVVDGDIRMPYLKSIPSGCSLIAKYIEFDAVKYISKNLKLHSYNSINLRGLKSIPDGFNPTVGGSLSLQGLKTIPSGFNPTVGRFLFLSGLESIDLNWRPTNVKGKIIVPKNLQKELDYCLEMARIDSQFDFLNKN